MIPLIIPIIAVVVDLVAQVLFFRSSRGKQFFSSIIVGFAAGFVALVALELAWLSTHCSADDIIVAIFVNAPAYAALAYCYYNFVQLGQTSLRIRLYTEIAAQPNGVKSEEITREYSEEEMLNVRIERLLESGDLQKRGERYFVGRDRLVRIAAILFTAKRLLLGKASEFE